MKRFTYVFGISMAIIMVLSLILPGISRSLQSAVTVAPPTATPLPPTPLPDSAISFDKIYLHPSGLFTVAEPSGWVPSPPETTSDNVRAVFSNSGAESIVQVDVTTMPTVDNAPITLDQVNTLFSSGWLAETWKSYTSWKESNREQTDDKLVIDFELTANSKNYVARQQSWTDGDWVYSVRVVTPENATDMLLYVLNSEAASLQPHKVFAGLPFDWSAYFDPQATHIIRYPKTWTVDDTAPGQPTSISDGSMASLRVESQAGTALDTQDSASTWVEDLRPGTQILSVEPVNRDETDGYSVAYSFKTVDGDSESGLAVLLNGPDDTLHVANLRFLANNVDLNAPEVDTSFQDMAEVMQSFYVMPELAGVDTDIATAPAATSG